MWKLLFTDFHQMQIKKFLGKLIPIKINEWILQLPVVLKVNNNNNHKL